jgi:undecaprenyl diphosphate synthase
MTLCIALSYGSRGEILRAVRRVLEKIEAHELYPDDLDEQTFEENLDTHGLPSVDMVIRTSGEQRISNFLLWQSAYAEYFFESAPWPDFTSEIFASLLRSFSDRERRFGRTPEQVQQRVQAEMPRRASPVRLTNVKGS